MLATPCAVPSLRCVIVRSIQATAIAGGHEHDGPPTARIFTLVLSFFINPIGVSDQAWGTIVTFTVRVLVPGP